VRVSGVSATSRRQCRLFPHLERLSLRIWRCSSRILARYNSV